MLNIIILLTILTGLYGLVFFIAFCLGKVTDVDWDKIEETHDKKNKK